MLKKIFFGFLIFSLLVMPMFVLAQTMEGEGNVGGDKPTTISFPSPIGCADLLCVVQRIVSLLYWVAIPVAVIMILYGGFKIMLAGGDPKKFSDGKKIILYAVIGLAIVLVSGGVVAIVKSVLGVTDQPQGPCPEGTEWTQINGSWDCS
jgi:hypothetical protein